MGSAAGWAGAAMAAASIYSSISGALMSAKAMKMEARAAQAAAEYNALLAEINARAEMNRQRRIARRALSSQFTQMAGKSGVVAEEGGWLEALAWNAGEYERGAMNAWYSGELTAGLDRSRGEVAKSVGKARAAAEITSGVGRAVGFGASLLIGGAYKTIDEVAP